MEQPKVVIIDGARTAIGRFGGAFKGTPAHELGAAAITAALERSGLRPDQVDEVIMGQVGGAGDAFNARRCALGAGLPVSSTAMNVNRLCGSGLQAIWTGVQEVLSGAADIVVAGGDENMSRQPFLDFGARDGYRLGNRTLEDGAQALVHDPFGDMLMGVTAECVAETYSVSRQEQDAFALRSQLRTAAAIDAGRFRDQIVPVTVQERKATTVVDRDEHPRPDTTLEKLAALKPVFREGGTVTAGNAAGMNDGGAAVVLMTEERARSLGLRARLRFLGAAVAGHEPRLMGYTPTFAIRKLLARFEMTPADVDFLELNEAFAAQAVAVIRDTGFDPERVNPNGGAIALGHPVGATGCILTIKAMHELERQGGRHAIVSMCIGGGQGIAALVERAGA
ncbi:MAG TPA: thiolase family protein [Chloroflexota bacterium]|nr:thiolase family protein [Chloroflexota bacterium]